MVGSPMISGGWHTHLVDGMAAAQRAARDALAQAGSAEQGVREVVPAQLAWVEESAELARLLYADVPDEVLVAAEPQFSQHNRHYVDDSAVGYAPGPSSRL